MIAFDTIDWSKGVYEEVQVPGLSSYFEKLHIRLLIRRSVECYDKL
jgi:hypothetical protein